MAIGNCKDCKHWHVAFGYQHWNICACPDIVEYDADIGPDGIAMYASARDDHGLECGLKTGPMFGCIKFVQR